MNWRIYGRSAVAVFAIVAFCGASAAVLAVPGDLNGDLDVDEYDFAAFHACVGGPRVAPGAGCELADFNGDARIDLADFAVFQRQFTGASEPVQLTAIVHGWWLDDTGQQPDPTFDPHTGWPATLKAAIEATTRDDGLESNQYIYIFDWRDESLANGNGWTKAAGERLFRELVEYADANGFSLFSETNVTHLITHGRGAGVGFHLARHMNRYDLAIDQITWIDPLDGVNLPDLGGTFGSDDPRVTTAFNTEFGDAYYSGDPNGFFGHPVGGAALEFASLTGEDHNTIVDWYIGTVGAPDGPGYAYQNHPATREGVTVMNNIAEQYSGASILTNTGFASDTWAGWGPKTFSMDPDGFNEASIANCEIVERPDMPSSGDSCAKLSNSEEPGAILRHERVYLPLNTRTLFYQIASEEIEAGDGDYLYLWINDELVDASLLDGMGDPALIFYHNAVDISDFAGQTVDIEFELTNLWEPTLHTNTYVDNVEVDGGGPLYTYTAWTGGEGDWSDGLHWPSQDVPNGSNYIVRVKESGADVTINQNVTLHSLANYGTLTVAANKTVTLTGSLGLRNFGTVILSSGAKIVGKVHNDSVLEIGTGAIFDYYNDLNSGTGEIHVAGTLNVLGYTVFDQNVILEGGTLDGNTEGFATAENHGVSGYGTLRETVGGVIRLGSGDSTLRVLNILDDGMLIAQGGANLTLYGIEHHTNAGVIDLRSGSSMQYTHSGNYDVHWTLFNTGQIAVGDGCLISIQGRDGNDHNVIDSISGTLTIQNGGTLSQSYHTNVKGNTIIEAGGLWEVISTSIYAADATVTNHGEIRIPDGKAWTVSGDFIGDIGTMTVGSGSTWNLTGSMTGATGDISVGANATWNCTGDINIDAGSISVGAGTTWNFNGSAIGGSGSVDLAGTAEVGAAATCSYDVELVDGILDGNEFGFTVVDGAEISGSGVLRGTIGGVIRVGSGQAVELQSATLTSAAAMFVEDGGTATWRRYEHHGNAGNIHVLAGGLMEYYNNTHNATYTFTNTGQIMVAGDVTTRGYSTASRQIIDSSDGTITVAAGGTFTQEHGAVLRGRIIVESGATWGIPSNTVYAEDVNATNSGSIVVGEGATWSFGGEMSDNVGAISIGNGATWTHTGALAGAAGTLVIGENCTWNCNGDINIDAGSISVGAGTTWNFNGSAIGGSGSIGLVGIAEINSPTTCSYDVQLTDATLDGNSQGFTTVGGAEITGSGTLRGWIGGAVLIGENQTVTLRSMTLLEGTSFVVENGGSVDWYGWEHHTNAGNVELRSGSSMGYVHNSSHNVNYTLTNTGQISVGDGCVFTLQGQDGNDYSVLDSMIGAITIADGGTMSERYCSTVKGNATIESGGTWEVAATYTALTDAIVTNFGQIVLKDSTNWTFSGEFVGHVGAISVGNGATWTSTGLLSGAAGTISIGDNCTWTCNGNLNIDSGSIAMGTATAWDFNGTTIDGTGTIVVAGTAEINSPTTCSYDVQLTDATLDGNSQGFTTVGGAEITGSGTLRGWIGGAVRIGENQAVMLRSMNVLEGTSFVVENGGSVEWYGWEHHTNTGDVELRSGSSMTYSHSSNHNVNYMLTNLGQISIGDGCVFSLQGYDSNDYNALDSTLGALTVADGGTLSLGHVSWLLGSVAIAPNGTWEMLPGATTYATAVDVANAGQIVLGNGSTWYVGGAFTGTGVIEGTSNIQINDWTDFGCAVHLADSTLDGNAFGFTTSGPGFVSMAGVCSLVDIVGGLVVVDSDTSHLSCSNVVITPSGEIRALNNGHVTFSNAVANAGTIRLAEEASCTVAAGGTNTGHIYVGNGAQLDLANPSYQYTFDTSAGSFWIMPLAILNVERHTINGDFLIQAGAQCTMGTNATVNGNIANYGTLTVDGTFTLNGLLSGAGATSLNAASYIESLNLASGPDAMLEFNTPGAYVRGDFSHGWDKYFRFVFFDNAQLHFSMPGNDPVTLEYELACIDLGDDPENHIGNPMGFVGNFSILYLRLHPGVTLTLVDRRDNGSWPMRESLYVHTLVLDAGSTLNTNGLNLYFKPDNFVGDAAAIINDPVALDPLVAEAGPDKAIASGSTTVLNGRATGGDALYTYEWSPATGLDDPSVAQPVASPGVTTEYTLTVWDGLLSEATDTVWVDVVPAAGVPFFDGFESGELGESWLASWTNDGRIIVTEDWNPASGSYHAALDDAIADSTYSLNEMTLVVDLEGAEDVTLSFGWQDLSEDYHLLAPMFVGSVVGDGVSISADGNSWVRVHQFEGADYGYQLVNIELDPIVVAAGMEYNDSFLIRFQQYDNRPIPTDGVTLDNVTVTASSRGFLRVEEVAPQPGSVLPWTDGAEFVRIRFSADVALSSDDIWVENAAGSRVSATLDNLASRCVTLKIADGTAGEDGLYTLHFGDAIAHEHACPFIGPRSFSFRALVGDITGDGRLNEADVEALQSSWMSTPDDSGWNARADLDRDGHVDEEDRGILDSPVPLKAQSGARDALGG